MSGSRHAAWFRQDICRRLLLGADSALPNHRSVHQAISYCSFCNECRLLFILLFYLLCDITYIHVVLLHTWILL